MVGPSTVYLSFNKITPHLQQNRGRKLLPAHTVKVQKSKGSLESTPAPTLGFQQEANVTLGKGTPDCTWAAHTARPISTATGTVGWVPGPDLPLGLSHPHTCAMTPALLGRRQTKNRHQRGTLPSVAADGSADPPNWSEKLRSQRWSLAMLEF